MQECDQYNGGGDELPKKARNIMKYRKFSLVCLFVSLIFTTIGGQLLRSMLSALMALLLIIIYITISIFFWRCPCCRKRLPMRFDKENDIDDIYVCPYCHTKFLDGDIIK